MSDTFALTVIDPDGGTVALLDSVAESPHHAAQRLQATHPHLPLLSCEPLPEMDWCEYCESRVPADEMNWLETEAPSWDCPGDGVAMCSGCISRMQDDLAEAAWERKYGDL